MKKRQSKRYDNLITVTLVMLLFSVLLIIGGLTFALYRNFLKGTTNNVIQAGTISFAYDENISRDNGIQIEDALPKSDSLGKIANRAHEYFDFSVNATTTLADIPYQIFVLKQNSSTLDENYVKVYLTLKNGTDEIASPLTEENGVVKTYYQLTGDSSSKLVYNGLVPKGSEEYHQEFRLRLWIGDSVDVNNNFKGRRFSVKVKVTANQAG